MRSTEVSSSYLLHTYLGGYTNRNYYLRTLNEKDTCFHGDMCLSLINSTSLWYIIHYDES